MFAPPAPPPQLVEEDEEEIVAAAAALEEDVEAEEEDAVLDCMAGDDESLDDVGNEEHAASDCAGGDDETLCVVCIDAERTHVFIPCGHRCVCPDCADLPRCPMCREVATGTYRVFC
jgi:hypothetical protein